MQNLQYQAARHSHSENSHEDPWTASHAMRERLKHIENLVANEVLLDPLVLEDIKSLDPDGSADLVRNAMRLFTQSSEELIQKLLAAKERIDPEAVRRTAHYLKSSAGALGANKLSALWRSLETGIGRGEDINIEEFLTTIRAVYSDTREAIRVAMQWGLA